MTAIIRQASILPHLAGRRLDQVAHELFPEFSRTQIQQWIHDGALQVNQQPASKNRQKLFGRETLNINAWIESNAAWQGEPIPLSIVYEDDAILIINKQEQLVMHPSAGNHTGTLLNGLIHHNKILAKLPRAGIVHRLDKDTTGLLVVAKTLPAYTYLVDQLQRRLIDREYEALVNGKLISGGTIDKAIARDPHNRLKFHCHTQGRSAITHYRVLRHYHGITHIRVKLETGRTHQIRVHCADAGFPIVGDSLYGGKKYIKQVTETIRHALMCFPRQALHAKRLGLRHPETLEYMHWEIDLPEDMVGLVDTMLP